MGLGMTMPRKMSDEERKYWAALWFQAARNMPRRKPNDAGYTVLALLLGRQIKDPQGRNCASQHTFSAANRGYRPRNPQQQRVLKMLAGPNGTALAKAIAITNNIDLGPYKHWPK